MKSTAVKVLVASLALASSIAQARSREVQTHEIDWNKKGTLSESFVMMCDDTSLDAIEIVIPGKAHKNFEVSASANITDLKGDIGCTVKKKVNADSTTYIFDASGGGCDIRVDKVRQDLREKPQSAEFSIGDAC